MPFNRFGEYEHKEDEIDQIARAMGQIRQQEGAKAGWAALPDGWEPQVKRLMSIKHVGYVLAVEMMLRLSLITEGQW